MPTLTSLEDVAQRLNATNTVVTAKAKSVKVNSTTTKTSASGVVDLSGSVITGIQDSTGATITPTDGVVKLPASTSTLTPSTTSVTDPA